REDTTMSVVRKIAVLTFVLTASGALAAVSAQAPIMEIRATGEYTLSGTTLDAAKQAAAAAATHKALQEAATRLRNLPEIQSLQLKPTQLEACLAAFSDPEDQP